MNGDLKNPYSHWERSRNLKNSLRASGVAAAIRDFYFFTCSRIRLIRYEVNFQPRKSVFASIVVVFCENGTDWRDGVTRRGS